MFTRCEPRGDGLEIDRNGGTLLVLEDEPASRERLASMLRLAGYAVDAERTLAGGVEAPATHKPSRLRTVPGLRYRFQGEWKYEQ